MKKALRKDIMMTMKGTFPRFLSIFFIVVLGVAFFSGIRVTKSDMQISIDQQFDQSKFQDIRILGTMGLTDDDVSSIKKISEVGTVEPSYYIDAISKINKTQEVLRVMADTSKLNKIAVSKGRMPKKNSECLIDTYLMNHSDYHIGDTISLSSGNDDKIEDSLKCSKLTIVGAGDSSFYLSRDRGTTSIGNGKINGFIVTKKDNFKSEVYTQISMGVKKAESLITYQENYKNTVDKVTTKLEKLGKTQSIIRREEIKKKAQDKLDRKIKTYEKEKKKAENKLAKAKKKLRDSKKKLSDSRKQLVDSERKMKSGQSSISKGWKQYQSGIKECKQGKKTLDANEKKISNGFKELNQKEKEVDGQIVAAGGIENIPEPVKSQLLAAKKKIAEEKKQLNAGKKELKASRIKLNNTKRKLEAAKKQLQQKERELKQAKQKVKSGYKKLASGEAKYKSGLKDYKSAERESKKKFKEAKEKLDDAQKDINEIETPKWHVLDRSKNQSYVEYGEDADRIGAIGKVFPMIFFLVAALVSLTTMTRMVEEERTQIGILKALGYSNGDIASKYIIYAFLATLGGSVAGVFLGEALLPRVIITAYTMMYTGVHVVAAPYEWEYSLMAAGIAILVTTGATILVCFKELKEKPSVLMRPQAPKEGKRILLEKISFLWKRLSFTWKATLRNLFRYKKRFLMTIFGIGGCMALLLVGFGLKDSIFSITKNQFGHLMNYQVTISEEDKLNNKDQEAVYTWIKGQKEITKTLKIYGSSVDVSHNNTTKTVNFVVPEDGKIMEQFVRLCNRTTHETFHLSDDGVIISEKLAKVLKVSKGDDIKVKDGDQHEVRVKIEQITENYMQHYMYMSKTLYDKIYGKQIKYNRYMCQSKEMSEKGESDFRAGALKQDGISEVSYVSEIQKEMDDMLGNLNVVILVLIVSAGLLAFVVLYNLNNINITERKGELATIKVLGFYDMETAVYVYRENILLTLIGSLVGIGLGIGLHRYVILTAEVDAIMFGRDIFPMSYVYSMLLTFVFAAVINLLMYYQIKRINMVESLKSTE
ncbi:MAG: FtsX-like permease family protein [Anaerostipes sp.]|nr:FtsX-like permease family protein [Anaerostipes sp.]